MRHPDRLLLFSIVLLGTVAAFAQSTPAAQKPATAKKAATAKAGLKKQAKITREEATRIALAKVPQGAIKEGELEKEKGKLVWSFDITTRGTKDVTEVQVDATTGDIVSVSRETAAAEARERQAETRKLPKKK